MLLGQNAELCGILFSRRFRRKTRLSQWLVFFRQFNAICPLLFICSTSSTLTLFCILLPKCNKAADLFSATHTTIHLTNIASSSHVNKFRAVKLQSDWFRNPKNQQSRHLCVCSLNVTLCKVAYFLILPAVCTQKKTKK